MLTGASNKFTKSFSTISQQIKEGAGAVDEDAVTQLPEGEEKKSTCFFLDFLCFFCGEEGGGQARLGALALAGWKLYKVWFRGCEVGFGCLCGSWLVLESSDCQFVASCGQTVIIWGDFVVRAVPVRPCLCDFLVEEASIIECSAKDCLHCIP
jgi:hypothetical protein